MVDKNNENVQWMVSVPSTDINFTLHVKRATEEEIKTAINIIENRVGKYKTKLHILNKELKKRMR